MLRRYSVGPNLSGVDIVAAIDLVDCRQREEAPVSGSWQPRAQLTCKHEHVRQTNPPLRRTVTELINRMHERTVECSKS